MKGGDTELRRIFNEINRFIKEIKDLTDKVSNNWNRIYGPDRILRLMDDILFFQRRYVPEKIRVNIELIKDSFEKYEEKREAFVKEGQFKQFIKNLIIPEEEKQEDFQPKSKKVTYTREYGRFKENPIENLNELLDGLIKIDQYFRKENLEKEITENDYWQWTNPFTNVTRKIPKQNIKWFRKGFWAGTITTLILIVLPIVLYLLFK